jgi:hypothetical protein
VKTRTVGASVAVVVVAIAASVVAIRLDNASSDGTSQATDTAGRLVVVSRSMPRPSQPGQPLHVMLIGGDSAGFRPQSGVVLTDDQCQADGDGVSHCLNTIRLASGLTISVRHPHRMMDVACLAPGEHVSVRMHSA